MATAKARTERKAAERLVVQNRRAFHDYHILERLEAGMVLAGTEVKSLREGGGNLKDSYAEVRNGEAILVGCHISPYSHGSCVNHLPERDRKLLLHRHEIHKLSGKTREKGLTLVPLSIYFKNGRAKIELGLAKGKRIYDKRESERRKDVEREIRRARRS